ncbi:MAG TPA: hypothetical protein VMF66_11665, partial [Candidatus Acidoferrum sp.]|nr:hypothetical protein [Candidatus Acidoferrum sp.]
LHTLGKDQESLAPLEKAVDLDPNFAMAYAVLGVAESNLGDRSSAEQYLQKAYDLRDRTSEREKFYIEAHYYDTLTDDMEKAASVFQQWISVYPRDNVPYDDLALAYEVLGEYDKALAAATDARRVDPQDAYAYQNQMAAYAYLGRFDDAKAVAQDAISQKRDTPAVHWGLMDVGAAQRDSALLQAQLSWAAGSPNEPAVEQFEAVYLDSQGQFKRGDAAYQKSTALAQKYGLLEMRPANLASQAVDQAECGFDASARQKAAAALKEGSNTFVQQTIALTYAFAGDAGQANKIIDAVGHRYPSDPILQTQILPSISALNLLNARKADEAVTALEPSRKYELGAPVSGATYLSIYVRGLAYLQLRDGAKAAAEFQKILDHPGLGAINVLYSLAELNRARACGLQNNTAQARIDYQNFLAGWKDADPDVPVLITAKAEYAKLH